MGISASHPIRSNRRADAAYDEAAGQLEVFEAVLKAHAQKWASEIEAEMKVLGIEYDPQCVEQAHDYAEQFGGPARTARQWLASLLEETAADCFARPQDPEDARADSYMTGE